MCDNPTCKAETKQCEILAEAFANAIPINGRCSYHEDHTKGLANVQGSLKILLWFLIPAFMVFITMQSAMLWKLYEHSKDNAAHHGRLNDDTGEATTSSDTDSGVTPMDTLQVGWR